MLHLLVKGHKRQNTVRISVAPMHACAPQGQVEALQRQHAQVAILEAALASSETEVQKKEERIAALGELQDGCTCMNCRHSRGCWRVSHRHCAWKCC